MDTLTEGAQAGNAGKPRNKRVVSPPETAVLNPEMPETAPRLRRSVAWTLAGNLTYALCQWGMLAVLAKSGDAAAAGQFALGLAVAAPVFMLTNLQLRGAQATDARLEFRFSHYFTLRLLVTCAGVAAIGSVLLLGRYEVSGAAVIAFVAAAKAIEALSDIVAGLLQRHERLDQVAVAMITKGVLSLAAFACCYHRTQSLVTAVAAITAVWMAVFAAYDLRRARELVGSGSFIGWEPRTIRALALKTAPLGAVMALGSLAVNIPRYVLVQHSGTRELGIFASLAYVVLAATFVVNALGQSSLVRLSKMFAEQNYSEFWLLLKKSAGFGLGVGIAGVLFSAVFGRAALAWLYRPEYADHVHALEVLAATVGISAVASFLGYGMTASRSFIQQLPVMLVTTATCGVSSFVLIPRFGIAGAAYALLITAVVQAVMTGVVLGCVVRSRRAA